MENGIVLGITGTYVDDSLNPGNEDFPIHTERALKKFESKPHVLEIFDFYVTQINTAADGAFTLSQPYYTTHLKATAVNASFETFCQDSAFLSCLTHTRPDLSCIANGAAQVFEKTFNVAKIKELNNVVLQAEKARHNMLPYGELDHDRLHFRVYSDATFTTDNDPPFRLASLFYSQT